MSIQMSHLYQKMPLTPAFGTNNNFNFVALFPLDHFCFNFELENCGSVEELERQISPDSLIGYSPPGNAANLDWRMADWEKNLSGWKFQPNLTEKLKEEQRLSNPNSPPQLSPVPSKQTRSSSIEERERPSECVVCARAASCCHFDVPSCLGCRSFFRRSVLTQRQYQCSKFGQCQIEKGEICRACRFDRCILGGMNARAIRDISLKMDLEATVAKLEARKAELMVKMGQTGGGEWMAENANFKSNFNLNFNAAQINFQRCQ